MPVMSEWTLADEVSMTDQNREQQGDIPTDTGELAGDRAEIDRATPKKVVKPDELESREAPNPPHTTTPNPPHTTTGKFTAPKFGSAGSGGLELEPGLDVD